MKHKSEEINQTVKQAHVSTASLGKFQDKVKNEKKAKEKSKTKKFEPVSGNVSAENTKSLALISKITGNSVSVNKGAAAKKEMGATVKRDRDQQRENRVSGRRSKAGLKAQTKHFDKKKRVMSGPAKKKFKKEEDWAGPPRSGFYQIYFRFLMSSEFWYRQFYSFQDREILIYWCHQPCNLLTNLTL